MVKDKEKNEKKKIETVDPIAKISLLYDFYGGLLTEKQREVMELYHEENYSLAEIAQEFGISRQAVHSSLKMAEKALDSYEKKLHLVSKFMKSRKVISEVDLSINHLIRKSTDAEVLKTLLEVKEIIDRLEE